MAVRTAYDPTAGEVLTATNVEKLAGGWIGYAEATSSQTGITSETDLTSLTVTVTAGSSRRLKITGNTILSRTVADGVTTFRIKEGATILNADQTQVAGSTFYQGIAIAVITPTTGAHTYKLTLERTTGTGSVSSTASSNQPAFILVEDIGPAS